MNDSPKTMANVFVAFLSFRADDFSRFFRLALFTLYMVKRLPLSAACLYSFFEHRPEPSSSEPFRSIEDSERFTSDCVERFADGCDEVAAAATAEIVDVGSGTEESFRLVGTYVDEKFGLFMGCEVNNKYTNNTSR